MKTYVIESNPCPANIHSIAGAVDREIKFPRTAKFAVVLASYYGGKGYTTHLTADAAIQKSLALSSKGYSHKIIDPEGGEYRINDSSPRGECLER